MPNKYSKDYESRSNIVQYIESPPNMTLAKINEHIFYCNVPVNDEYLLQYKMLSNIEDVINIVR